MTEALALAAAGAQARSWYVRAVPKVYTYVHMYVFVARNGFVCRLYAVWFACMQLLCVLVYDYVVAGFSYEGVAINFRYLNKLDDIENSP